MTASERREILFDILCVRREENIANLAFELNVSERTIARDLITLSLSGRPICTKQGNGGGVYVMEGGGRDVKSLTDKEESVIRKIIPMLDEEDAKTMLGILDRFKSRKRRK